MEKLNLHITVSFWSRLWWENKAGWCWWQISASAAHILEQRQHNWNFPSSAPARLFLPLSSNVRRSPGTEAVIENSHVLCTLYLSNSSLACHFPQVWWSFLEVYNSLTAAMFDSLGFLSMRRHLKQLLLWFKCLWGSALSNYLQKTQQILDKQLWF